MGDKVNFDNVPPSWLRGPRRWWDRLLFAGTVISLFGFVVGLLDYQNGVIDASLIPWYPQGNAIYRALSER